MKTQIMGILNVTPDSFSDGGKYNDIDRAMIQCDKMVKEGATIIDVGGESTRPGFIKVEAADEIDRVIPVVEKIKFNFDVAVSLDTYKGEVAKAGIEAGIDIVNDIWGLQYDDIMSKVVAEADVKYCMMHNLKEPNENWTMDDFMNSFKSDLDRAYKANISKDKIIYDPGIGFAKSQEQNLMIMANLARLNDLGLPILLGASRKSVINYVCDLPVDQRLEGTLATTACAVMAGCDYVRVHDVAENYRFIQMFEGIMERK